MGKMGKLIKENTNYLTKVNNIYQEIVVEIECYIRVELNSVDSELALNEMYKSFIDAQEDEKKIQEIIQNKNLFCDNIVSKYKKNSSLYNLKSLLGDYLPIGIYALIFFVLMDMITTIFKIKPQNFDEIFKINYTLKILPLLGVLISFLIAMNSIRNITKPTDSKKGGIILINSLIFVVSSSILIIGSLALSKLGILTIVQFTAFKIGVMLIIFGIIVFIICTILQIINLKKKK